MFDYELPSGWQWVMIEDVQAPEKRAIITGPFGSSIGSKFFVEEGIPVIRGKNLKLGAEKFVDNGFVFITEEKAEELKGYKAYPGDILFTAAGTIGQVGMILEDCKHEYYVISNKQMRARFDSTKVDAEFAYYWFSSKPMVTYIKALDTGSTIPLINLGILRKLPMPLPPLEEQIKIKKHLVGLDNKIELNCKTNQTLEQIAQAIFKSWFVDFDPVKAKIKAKKNGQDPELAAMCAISGKAEEQLKGLDEAALQQLKTTAALFPNALVESELGEIPDGWSVSSIDDVCDFQNGYAFKSKEMSKSPEDAYKVFKMGGIKKGGGLNKSSTKDYYEKCKCEKLDRYIIKKGNLLMCMTDMKNNVALLGHTALMDVNDEYILNQRVGLLRTKNKSIANYPFLYILTNSQVFIEDLRSRANSGVQVNLSTSEIKLTKFVLPSEEVHLEFDKLTERLQEQIFSLEAEQEYLARIRDALLPKLLSGEITIGGTQSVVEAVA